MFYAYMLVLVTTFKHYAGQYAWRVYARLPVPINRFLARQRLRYWQLRRLIRPELAAAPRPALVYDQTGRVVWSLHGAVTRDGGPVRRHRSVRYIKTVATDSPSVAPTEQGAVS